MAYTTINNGKIYFNTKLYTGNGSTQSITGVGFQPDWVWLKARSSAYSHQLFDVVRGATKLLSSEETSAEQTISGVTSFDSDGFAVGSDAGSNNNTTTFASWNWPAAGTAPSNTYAVKVVSDGGNKYRFDDFGTSAVTLEISEGGTFTFDQSDASNSGHPIRFSTTSDGTHNSGTEYTTGVTTNGTPGSAGAYTRITVAASAPTLYYYCSSHSGMGGQANTPTTNSFSNFSGSIQTNISPNTTSGFSIVSWDGSDANATIGHGLGSAPRVIIIKNRESAEQWYVYHESMGNGNKLTLNDTSAQSSAADWWQDTSPTSSVFSVSGVDGINGPHEMIAYCFAEKKGFSKFGSYTGNGNADGTFVYTGFKPAWVLCKQSSGSGYGWTLFDNKRAGYNQNNYTLQPDGNAGENTGGGNGRIDLLSNGFKQRSTDAGVNGNGSTYIYMAFAENPFTSSTGTPVTAR